MQFICQGGVIALLSHQPGHLSIYLSVAALSSGSCSISEPIGPNEHWRKSPEPVLSKQLLHLGSGKWWNRLQGSATLAGSGRMGTLGSWECICTSGFTQRASIPENP